MKMAEIKQSMIPAIRDPKIGVSRTLLLSVHRFECFLEFASVAFFSLCKRFEPVCDFFETFFARIFNHAGIHIGIFVRFARNCRFQV